MWNLIFSSFLILFHMLITYWTVACPSTPPISSIISDAPCPTVSQPRMTNQYRLVFHSQYTVTLKMITAMCAKTLNNCQHSMQSKPESQMMFKIVFWDILPCKIIVDRRSRGTYWSIIIPDDGGGSTYLWNVGRQLFYMAVHPRRQFWTSCSPLWELEISHRKPKFCTELFDYNWI
jgi:hypothetical protein